MWPCTVASQYNYNSNIIISRQLYCCWSALLNLRGVKGLGHVLFLHIIIGSVLYPWVNCTGIRTLNPGFRGSPLTHGCKTDPIMIHKRVTGKGHVLFLHIIIGFYISLSGLFCIPGLIVQGFERARCGRAPWPVSIIIVVNYN